MLLTVSQRYISGEAPLHCPELAGAVLACAVPPYGNAPMVSHTLRAGEHGCGMFFSTALSCGRVVARSSLFPAQQHPGFAEERRWLLYLIDLAQILQLNGSLLTTFPSNPTLADRVCVWLTVSVCGPLGFPCLQISRFLLSKPLASIRVNPPPPSRPHIRNSIPQQDPPTPSTATSALSFE